ncbi:hypothetical protein [Gemmatimonas sp.]
MQSSNPSGSTHLMPERLASFDESPFNVDELAHLAACSSCRVEYDAVRSVVAMAGALGSAAPDVGAPRLVEFDRILAGMREAPHEMAHAPAERSARAAVPMPRSRAFAPLMRRAAAALLLVGGGAVVGRVSGELGVARVAAGAVANPLRASATPAAYGDRPFADLSYGSVEQATIALNEAQRAYERASLWLASNDTTIRDPEVFRARLAALDQMMEASRVALRDAPQDPVLNHYYLSAYSAREATLQALGSALPVDKIIERY